MPTFFLWCGAASTAKALTLLCLRRGLSRNPRGTHLDKQWLNHQPTRQQNVIRSLDFDGGMLINEFSTAS